MVPKGCPFEEKLIKGGNDWPAEIRSASTWVNDTLELSWASARQIFGDKAIPEHAIQIYDRILEKIKTDGVDNKFNEIE